MNTYAGKINEQQALAAGFQQHLSQPVDLEELVKGVSSINEYVLALDDRKYLALKALSTSQLASTA